MVSSRPLATDSKKRADSSILPRHRSSANVGARQSGPVPLPNRRSRQQTGSSEDAGLEQNTPPIDLADDIASDAVASSQSPDDVQNTVIDLTSPPPRPPAIEIESSPLTESGADTVTLPLPKPERPPISLFVPADGLAAIPEIVVMPPQFPSSPQLPSMPSTTTRLGGGIGGTGGSDTLSMTELFSVSHGRLWPFVDDERVSRWGIGQPDEDSLAPAIDSASEIDADADAQGDNDGDVHDDNDSNDDENDEDDDDVMSAPEVVETDATLPLLDGPDVRPHQRFEICRASGSVSVLDPPTHAEAYVKASMY